ncbi:MAG: YoaK family protein [Lachnospiraceae bacterium]
MLTKLFKFEQLTESLFIAVLMAFIGGYLDIYTYLSRGKVFANTQTGNLVLLGYNIAEGNWGKTTYYIFPILFFMFGVALGENLEHRWENRKRVLWHQVAIIIEGIILVGIMAIPAGPYDVIANILISFVCGLQVQTFRKANNLSYSSIMFTGNLKNAAERISNFTITKEKTALESGIIYSIIIGMFIVGAFLGSLLTKQFHEKSIGFVGILLFVVFLFIHLENRSRFDKKKGQEKISTNS